METLEKFLVLLFGAIVVAVLVSNPAGISALFGGVTNLARGTVGAFSGFRQGSLSRGLTGTALPYGV